MHADKVSNQGLGRQRERFESMQLGVAFVAWLAASGTAVLLTAFLAAACIVSGLEPDVQVLDPISQLIRPIGLVGAIALLVFTLIADFAGGYVTGRIARSCGAQQGMWVWLCAAIAAVVVGLLGLIDGVRFSILGRLNDLRSTPLNEGALSTAGVLTVVAVAAVALIGAILGGIHDIRSHRKVDAVGPSPLRLGLGALSISTWSWRERLG